MRFRHPCSTKAVVQEITGSKTIVQDCITQIGLRWGVVGDAYAGADAKQ